MISPGAAQQWPILIVLAPLLAAACVIVAGERAAAWATGAAWLGVCAGLLVLGREVFAGAVVTHSLGGWEPPLGIAVAVDGLSLVFLGLTLVVAAAVAVYGHAYFRSASPALRRGFQALWLTSWAALNATFVAADLFNIYVTLELITITAVPLVALAGGVVSLAASIRYLLFALLGSMIYLLGVALIYAVHGSLDIYALGAQLTAAPATTLGAALITAGLMAKAALFPLHAWLPPAHAIAPGPVSALLSALVVKSAVYVLLRLWWWVFPALQTTAVLQILGGFGALAMLYGSLQALRQTRLKRVVAYSTVAQLGYLLLVFPLASVAAWQGAVYHALSHGLAKTALFLAAANVIYVTGHDRLHGMRGRSRGPLTVSVFAFAIGSVSLMGLPPTGGFLAKWLLLRAALTGEAWIWAGLLLVSSLLAAAYLFRVLALLLRRGPRPEAPGRPLPLVMSVTPLAVALGGVALALVGEPLLTLLEAHAPPGAAR